MKEKPEIKIQKQGQCIIEQDGHNFIICFPDNGIEIKESRRSAERACKEWFKHNVQPENAGIGSIKWQ